MRMTNDSFRRVESWILRNGRPVEAARYAVLFQGGSVESFLKLLSLYQNPDGGFGNALEPDSWNPHSSPYATSHALTLLREVGFTDYEHPIYQRVTRYLAGGDGFENGRWMFTVPGNDDYPHAPWWSYSGEVNRDESPGLTAALSAFVLDSCPKGTPLYKIAADNAADMLRLLMTLDRHGEMGIGGYLALRSHWQALGLTPDIQAVDARLRTLVNAAIQRDPAQWEAYVPRPSAFIRSPASPFYAGNEADVQAELDYLIRTLPEDGVWPINWCWFDLQERYASAFAVSETWWKADKAIEKLQFLRAFGRIED